jgi:hypothetical protein
LEQISNKLLLDIKALVLLTGSEEALRRIIRSQFAGSHDDQIRMFSSLLGAERPSGAKSLFFSSLGQLVLASFLIIAGLVTLAPGLLGLTSPAQIVNYFVQALQAFSVKPLADPLLPLIDFLLAVGLLLSAFSTLRLASSAIKRLVASTE